MHLRHLLQLITAKKKRKKICLLVKHLLNCSVRCLQNTPKLLSLWVFFLLFWTGKSWKEVQFGQGWGASLEILRRSVLPLFSVCDEAMLCNRTTPLESFPRCYCRCRSLGNTGTYQLWGTGQESVRSKYKIRGQNFIIGTLESKDRLESLDDFMKIKIIP